MFICCMSVCIYIGVYVSMVACMCVYIEICTFFFLQCLLLSIICLGIKLKKKINERK